MSKPSRRPNREAIKEKVKERKTLFKILRKQQENEGIETLPRSSMPNRKSPYKTEDEERMARNLAVTDSMRIMLAKLPVLLKRLGNIPDPRNPKKIKHKLTLITIYGILTFVLQMASRREANREMTQPVFIENLKLFFPEFEDLPHNDTLMRLLARIDVHEIENAQIDLVNSLIRKKKFNRYLINNYYPVAFDGSQKFSRDWLWSEECLDRNLKVKAGEDPKKQYYVYILEASLAFQNGMTIPLMSEFLSYTEGDSGTNKQDCEQKAFKRLAERLKAKFPKLRIMALLDGLYPNGPMMELIRKKKWGFMIVLQNKSLPSV